MLSKNSPLLGKPRNIYRIVAVIFAALILMADELSPLGVSVGEAYCALVLIGLIARDKQLVLWSALVGTALIIIGIFLSRPESQLWIALVNRFLSIFMVWLTAVFSILLIQSAEEKKESEEIKRAYQLLKNESSFVKLNRDIAVLANSKQGINEALEEALKIICLATDWSIGHLYLKDNETNILNSTKIWFSKESEQFQSFQKVTENTPLGLGEGLPGRVLENKKAEWIPDVLKDKNFPRARQSVEIKIRAGLAFPILIDSKVIGVMEFFSDQPLEPDIRLLEVLESIGFLLGRIFERYQAVLQKEDYDQHLRSLYNRLESARQEEGERIAHGIDDDIHFK